MKSMETSRGMICMMFGAGTRSLIVLPEALRRMFFLNRDFGVLTVSRAQTNPRVTERGKESSGKKLDQMAEQPQE